MARECMPTDLGWSRVRCALWFRGRVQKGNIWWNIFFFIHDQEESPKNTMMAMMELLIAVKAEITFPL